MPSQLCGFACILHESRICIYYVNIRLHEQWCVWYISFRQGFPLMPNNIYDICLKGVYIYIFTKVYPLGIEDSKFEPHIKKGHEQGKIMIPSSIQQDSKTSSRKITNSCILTLATWISLEVTTSRGRSRRAEIEKFPKWRVIQNNNGLRGKMRDSNSISSGLDVYWPPHCENNQGMITKKKNSTAPVISSVRESGLIGLTPKPCCFSAYSVVMKIVSQNTLFCSRPIWPTLEAWLKRSTRRPEEKNRPRN